jgi:hypothetical protein
VRSGRDLRGKGEGMTAEYIKQIILKIEDTFGIKFSDYREIKKGGKVVFIFYTIEFKVD